MSSNHPIERTAARLREAASRGLRPFGAERHRFHVQEPVRESELRAFEARHEVSIPDDYRAFLASVSRGGAEIGRAHV